MFGIAIYDSFYGKQLTPTAALLVGLKIGQWKAMNALCAEIPEIR